MIKRRWKLSAMVIVSVFVIHMTALAGNGGEFSTTPQTNQGKKWRIGYYEGGAYTDYQQTLNAMVKGLMALGWIETSEIISQQGKQTETLWKWLSTNMRSKYLEFVKDAHYSANWDSKLRKETVSIIINRLKQEKDIDLMIAMGTWAGQDLANNEHQTPMMVLSSSDAVASGIINSPSDSGYDHVHAHVDPFRYERQLRIFHKFVGFKKLGVAYEDTLTGRSIAAIETIEKVAQERGFEVISCFTKDDNVDLETAEKSVIKCFAHLAKQVDAIYLTNQNGVSPRSIPELVKIANVYRIPTFSQSGSHEVKQGVLLSMSRPGFMPIGLHHAKTLAQIFNGAKPRKLDQVFEEPPAIAVNLKTAEKIELYLHADILAAADEIYREISMSPPVDTGPT